MALHAGRADALLQETGVVDDEHRIPVAEMVDHVPAHVIEDLVGIPFDPVQHPLDTVRAVMAGLLGQGPAVLALQRSNQPPHIGQRRLPRLRPAEPVHEPLVHRIQFTRPHTHISKVPTHNHINERPGHPRP